MSRVLCDAKISNVNSTCILLVIEAPHIHSSIESYGKGGYSLYQRFQSNLHQCTCVVIAEAAAASWQRLPGLHCICQSWICSELTWSCRSWPTSGLQARSLWTDGRGATGWHKCLQTIIIIAHHILSLLIDTSHGSVIQDPHYVFTSWLSF